VRFRGAPRSQLGGVECAEPGGQPRSTPRPHPPEYALALVGQRQAHPAAVVRARSARDEAVALEPIDVIRHRGRGNALAGGELVDADPRGVLDLDEQRHLLRRDARLSSLASQLATDAQEHGPEPVGDGQGVDSGAG
jgi:hypothetical protein